MTEVIGQILPLAIAVALSTIPIIATILILLSNARPLVSVVLLIGWAVGVALVLAGFTVVIALIPPSSPPRNDTSIGAFRILLGVALLFYSLGKWRGRSKEPREDLPRWMEALGRINAIGALGFGLALAFRPKNIILSIAAAVVITDASLRVDDALVVIVTFTVIGVSTVAAPIIGHFAAPEKTRGPLDATRTWIIGHSATIMLVVALLVSAVIIGSGITKLQTRRFDLSGMAPAWSDTAVLREFALQNGALSSGDGAP